MFVVEDNLDKTQKKFHAGANAGEEWYRLGVIRDPLGLLDAVGRKNALQFEGKMYNPSDYLVMLAQNGLRCHGMCCSSEQPFISLEQHKGKKRTLIRAFVRKGDRDVLLTKDHDIAKSLGGANVVENLKPLCYDCNNLKSALESRLVSINNKWPVLREQLPVEIKRIVEDFANIVADEKNKKKLSLSNVVLYYNLSSFEESQSFEEKPWNTLFKSIGIAFGFSEKGFHEFMEGRPGNTHWKAKQKTLVEYPLNLWKRLENVEVMLVKQHMESHKKKKSFKMK